MRWRSTRHAATLDDTLTATAGGRTVFTLVVNADGSWTFDLDDQLDHVDNGLNNENLQLRTSLNDLVGVPSIDFSSIVVATDRDGDEITLQRGQLHDCGSGRHSGSERRDGCGVGEEDGMDAAVDEAACGSQRQRSVDRQQGRRRDQRGGRDV